MRVFHLATGAPCTCIYNIKIVKKNLVYISTSIHARIVSNMPLEPKIRKNFTPSRTKKLFKFGLYAKLKFEFSCSQFGLSTLDYDSENSINQTRYLPQNHLTKETEQPEIILDEQHNYRFDPHITVASKTSRKQASKHIWTQKTQESFQNVQKVWRTHLLNKSGLFDSRDEIRDIVNRRQRPHTKALQPRTR